MLNIKGHQSNIDIVWATQNKNWHDEQKEYENLSFEWKVKSQQLLASKEQQMLVNSLLLQRPK